MARIRTTKKLGQRVNRTYLKRLFPIPQWRRILTVACLATGLSWLGLNALTRNQTPYTAGALTPSHAFLGQECSVCHGESAGIGKKVTDQRCAACHDGPVHQASQKTTPACISCHVEHRGEIRLARTSDEGCQQCHSSLETKTGKLTVAKSVSSFGQHPEFAAVKSGVDNSGLKFNHQKHIGDLGQKCADCHKPADVTAGAATPDRRNRISSHALMTIPTFEAACKSCHALNFDDNIPEAAPHHEQPEVVAAFAKAQLEKYIASHRGEAGKSGAGGSAAGWVTLRLASAEKKFRLESCGRCHDLAGGPEFAATVVVPVQLSARWFSKALFDHGAHQAITCGGCHVKAARSELGTDLLIPGVAQCRQCHNGGSTGARADCGLCHVYHDWSKEKRVDGKYERAGRQKT
jgi:hypothetical protein